eukprot:TRINITY_DN19977_c0_g1_i1.p1 TRINITY_DN19977_c0_g1~~TRINITY_DN19977_c0_g1_i1.p1  ORF type:complete len:1271 (+),score=296.78 TRINITY_DN19977_c0_g1_i1:52-3813(+)
MSAAPCEARWDIQNEGAVFMRRALCLRSHDERELVIERISRILKGTSPGLSGGMRRCRSPRKLEYQFGALQPPKILHNNKRLIHVLFALLGREGVIGKQPLLENSVIALRPPLLERTDDETEVVVDTATIDAVCRSEASLGLPDTHLTSTLSRCSPPEGPPAADIYGSGSFRILISELKRIATSTRVATGSALPPVFIESLTSFITRKENRDFFFLRRNIPLREVSCEHRWAALRQFYCDGMSSAEIRLSSIGNEPPSVDDISTEAVAHRSAVHQARECLAILHQCLTVLDKVPEGRVIARQFDDYINRVRKAPALYGFRTAQQVENALSRSLSFLSECVVQTCEGYSMVDGAHHRYNQLTSKTPQPMYFVTVATLCEPQCAPVDMVTLRARLRGKYRLVLSSCRHHNVSAVCSSVVTGEVPYGISIPTVREASLRALLEVLCTDDTVLDTWYLQVPETYLEEATRLLETSLEVGGVYNDPELARCLRCNIVLHQKEPKFVAVELAKRAVCAALVIPSENAEILLGTQGGSWEQGRGHYFKPQHEVMCTTTLLTSSLSITGTSRFRATKILHEDTEGWGPCAAPVTSKDLPKRYEEQDVRKNERVFTKPKEQAKEAQPEEETSSIVPTSPQHNMEDDKLLVCMSCSEESCIVEVASLPDAESVAKETFDVLISLPPGRFHLCYVFEGKKRVVKTEKHFRTFLSLAKAGKVGMDGGLPELCVALKNAKPVSKAVGVSEQKSPESSAGLTATPVSDIALQESRENEEVAGVCLARLELERCQDKLAELEAEQLRCEEGRVWQNELVEIMLRSMDPQEGITPLLSRTLSVHKRNITSFTCILELIKAEVGYQADLSYLSPRGEFVTVYDDVTLHLFLQQKWGDLLLFVKKRSFVPKPVKSKPDRRPKVKEEFAMVNITFNPPTLKVVGKMEQRSIDGLSKKLVAVCPSIAQGRKGKRVPSLMFKPEPEPHWTVTYPYAFCDQTMQSMLFLALLDTLHATGGWQVRETSSCTCPIDLPKSKSGAGEAAPALMVDFYKFTFSRQMSYKPAKKKKSRRASSVDKSKIAQPQHQQKQPPQQQLQLQVHARPRPQPPQQQQEKGEEQSPVTHVEEQPTAESQENSSREPPVTVTMPLPDEFEGAAVANTVSRTVAVDVGDVRPAPPQDGTPAEQVLKYSAKKRKMSAGRVGLKIWGTMTWEQRLTFLKDREAASRQEPMQMQIPSEPVATTETKSSQGRRTLPLGRRRSLSVGARPITRDM